MFRIETNADLWKVARIFQALAPDAERASDAPALFDDAKRIALVTLHRATALHITSKERGHA